MTPRKTMSDLIACDKPFLTADDVAGVLKADPHTIRLMAKQRPEMLGFPVMLSGDPRNTYYARVKIPRIPFLRYMGANV